MATILQILRSSGTTAPNALAQGELAYTYGVGNQGNNGDRLFIGTGTETNGVAANIDIIGGKYFTNLTVKNLSDYTDSSIRESRDINNKLNFLTGRKKLNDIKNCQVIDLSKEARPLVTISSLI